MHFIAHSAPTRDLTKENTPTSDIPNAYRIWAIGIWRTITYSVRNAFIPACRNEDERPQMGDCVSPTSLFQKLDYLLDLFLGPRMLG